MEPLNERVKGLGYTLPDVDGVICSTKAIEALVNEEVVATLERLKEVVIDDTGVIDAELARRSGE